MEKEVIKINKRGTSAIVWILIIVAVLTVFGIFGGDLLQTVTPGDGDGDEPTAEGSCAGGTNVGIDYSDIDMLEKGTDPATALVIYAQDGTTYDKTVTDDQGSQTIPTLSSFKALVARATEANMTYFASPIEFSSGCNDVVLRPEIKNAVTATTWTVVNDDGVTKNANATDEAMDASSSYTHEHVLRSPSKDCISAYGAVIACAFDATDIQKIEAVSGVSETSAYTIYEAHDTTYGPDSPDTWEVFLYDGEVCDGAKAEFALKITTTSDTIGADDANYKCQWMPLNYDLDADSLDLIGPAIYDEDNNAIYTAGGKNKTVFTS